MREMNYALVPFEYFMKICVCHEFFLQDTMEFGFDDLFRKFVSKTR